MVSQPFGQIYSGKCTFSDFLFSLEKFMKVPLVDALFKLKGPYLYDRGLICSEGELFLAALSL
jgi:hypothetical protein